MGLKIHELVVVGGPEDLKKSFNRVLNTPFSVALNGGYYTFSFWYQDGYPPPPTQPIGLFKGRHFENLSRFLEDQTTRSYCSHFASKSDTLKTKIANGTFTPELYRDCYGAFLIDEQGASLLSLMEIDQNPDRLESVRYCQSAAPILVSDGTVTFTDAHLQDPRFQWNEIESRYGYDAGACPPGTLYHADQLNPRSAIGLNSEGDTAYFVTVKGREEKVSEGLTLPQFADLTHELGLSHALNLDGGYSAFQLTKKGEQWNFFDSATFPRMVEDSNASYIITQPIEKSLS